MTNATIPLLLEPEQLAEIIATGNSSLLIVSTCSSDNYQRYHLPGALHIPPKALQLGKPPVPGKLPEPAQLQEMFSAIGLTADKHVIVYDDEGGGWAGRLIWTLDVLGHNNYSYLNGGLHAWLAAGQPTTTDIPAVARSDFQVSIDTIPIAEVEDVLASLDDENSAIWDARSSAEHDGSKVLAKRGGHIPGAINIDWLELMDKERQLRLVDLEALQQRLNALGLSADKKIITHCQSHHRSGLSYLAMKILGYQNIKGYHGSWGEWGNLDHTPIDNPSA